MSDIVVVTNRKLCRENFLNRIERLLDAGVDKIILREKDMDPAEYRDLAKRVIRISDNYNTDLILHNYIDIAIELNHPMIHLPIPSLRTLDQFNMIGVSCHSLKDVEIAEKFNASYITFGHVFSTDCKKNLEPRGLEALRDICHNTALQVYAIGGMTPDNYKDVLKAGAKGCAIMSSAMMSHDPKKLIKEFKEVEDLI